MRAAPVVGSLLLVGTVYACAGGDGVANTSGGDGGGPDGLSLRPAVPSTVSGLQLAGKVMDPEGVPVPGAYVSTGSTTTLSASDGWFDVWTDGPGVVTVSKPGWGETEVAWDGEPGFLTVTIEPLIIRALRVNGGAAGDDEAFARILGLADDTAVNGLAFDTKQEGGTVLYDTRVAEAHRMGAVTNAYDVSLRIAQAREHGLYLITRIVTFEDAIRVAAFPDEALAGRWLDPRDPKVWEYPLALAVEACELGFDEIQFDYVRFPSGESVKTSGQLDMSEEERVNAIEGFLREARLRIHPLGCAVSADVFGVVVASSNDQGIGQRPEELSRQLDAFSPMIYPSHYDDGWQGLAEPNDHPYDMTSWAIEDSLRRIEPGTILRPWLQGFWWSDEQIRRSIQAAEDHDVGWILWNAVSNFNSASLPTEDEVDD